MLLKGRVFGRGLSRERTEFLALVRPCLELLA
jgi:hypothetical protein